MDMVVSKDGTRIACWRTGSGPPLLLVHGAMQDHTRWEEIAAPLEEHVTVVTFDRRGRGQSGDGDAYAIEREYEDIIAVLALVGRPSAVLGHSYGAACALGAALLTDQIDKLILYEPAVLEGVRGFYTSEPIVTALRTVERQLGAGEVDVALVTVMRDVVGVPAADIETMRAMPAWPGRVAAAHTVLRELQAEATWIFDPARYRDLAAPTLFLTGSESLRIAREGTEALDAALPNSAIVVLEGQGHGAITTAPELFVREVLKFLRPR